MKRVSIHELALEPHERRNSFKNEDEILDSQKIFKYLTTDYRTEAYYWEIIIFFKKLFLTALSGLRNLTGVDLKLMLIILVILIYVHVSIIKKP